MPRTVQTEVVDPDEFIDPPTEPDGANEEEESGALQDALLDGDEDDEVEVGMCLMLHSYMPNFPPFCPFSLFLWIFRNAISSTSSLCTCLLLPHPCLVYSDATGQQSNRIRCTEIHTHELSRLAPDRPLRVPCRDESLEVNYSFTWQFQKHHA